MLINRQCRNLFDSLKDINLGAIHIMKSHMAERHSQEFSSDIAFRTGFCDRELFVKLDKAGVRLGKDQILDIIRAKFDLYLYEKFKDNPRVDYGEEDMNSIAKKAWKFGYKFSVLEDRSGAFYDPDKNSIWMCRISDYIVEEYERDFKRKTFEREDYNPELLEALKHFPRTYIQDRKLYCSNEAFISNFIHEYLHMVYDRLAMGLPDSTVNEAFSWFCSYMVIARLEETSPETFEQAQSIKKPGSVYEEPKKIEEYSKLLWRRYSRSDSDNFVSWVIEKQEEVEKSSKSDRVAFKRHLLPENFREDLETFNHLIEELHDQLADLEQLLDYYRERMSEFPIEQLIQDLEEIRAENPNEKERKIIENQDRLEEANKYLGGLMRQEVKHTQKMGKELIAFEDRLERLDEVDKKELRKIRTRLEETKNPKLRKQGGVQCLIWDILVSVQKIGDINKEVHGLAREHR